MNANWKRTIVIIMTCCTLLLPLNMTNALTEQEQLEELQRKIDALQGDKENLQSQINSNNYTVQGYNAQISALYGEAQIYQKSMDEIELQIKQIQLVMDKLNKDILAKQTEIKKNQETIALLEKESKERIDESYMKFRMIGSNTEVGSNLLFTSNINSYFKNSQYKEVIQNDTNNILVELARLKAQLDTQKKQLDEKLIEQKKQQELINIKAEDLKKKKGEVDAKMEIFYAKVNELYGASSQFQARLALLDDEQARISAEAELIKQQIMQSFVTTGEYVLAGTIIGFQGCSGYCFGEHVHFSVYLNGVAVNPCGQLEPGGMGCGGNGPLKSPLRGNVSYNSGFGWRSFDNSFHDGIDVTGFPSGAPVYAAHDGYIERGVDCWHTNMGYPTNGCANYVRIAQHRGSNQGYVTGYWHFR